VLWAATAGTHRGAIRPATV
jgi:hypothetical protein